MCENSTSLQTNVYKHYAGKAVRHVETDAKVCLSKRLECEWALYVVMLLLSEEWVVDCVCVYCTCCMRSRRMRVEEKKRKRNSDTHEGTHSLLQLKWVKLENWSIFYFPWKRNLEEISLSLADLLCLSSFLLPFYNVLGESLKMGRIGWQIILKHIFRVSKPRVTLNSHKRVV